MEGPRRVGDTTDSAEGGCAKGCRGASEGGLVRRIQTVDFENRRHLPWQTKAPADRGVEVLCAWIFKVERPGAGSVSRQILLCAGGRDVGWNQKCSGIDITCFSEVRGNCSIRRSAVTSVDAGALADKGRIKIGHTLVFGNLTLSFDSKEGISKLSSAETLVWLNSRSLQKANPSMPKPRSPGDPSERGERSGLVGIKCGVFRDADHGEHFGEVWGKTTDGYGLAGFVGLHQHLDDQRDARGVEVFDALEVEQNALVNGLVE